MVMILRKLVADHKDRIIYASLVIIAANSGGAFSPIGDVTTIMLWNKGLITAAGVIKEIIVPSIISMVVPAFLLSRMLKGELVCQGDCECKCEGDALTESQRKTVFFLGVGGLIFVPIFKSITHLPPFVGILLVLGLLWTVTEVFYRHLPHNEEGSNCMQKRVSNIISRTAFDNNHFMVTGIIGVLSSIVDNVPLVAGCMGMYPMAATGDFACDGIFWQLLAYCAGVGGSMLIIGSAAGVVVMGLEKITFGWYMKHITWIAFIGYFLGIIAYYVQRVVLGI